MKAPSFWQRPPGLAAGLLRPAASVYGAIATTRLRRPGTRADVPVICVGNLTVGGTGKTPTALSIAQALRMMGHSPAFLLRGYGGRLPGPVLVDPARHGPEDVGDEALLLARGAPTVVSRDRPAGAALATEGGADCIVMDDGLQNRSLGKDLAFAVFDGAVGLGNGLPLPAGPLRAPLGAQWPLVGAAIVIGSGAAGDAVATDATGRGLPVFPAWLEPDPEAAGRLAGRRVLAFAGIGRPAKFFATCREIGAEVVETRAFPDHHRFTSGEMTALLDRAERGGLVPVTTEKDAVRFSGRDGVDPRLGLVQTLPVRCRFADEPSLVRRLAQVFEGSGRPSRVSTASGLA